MPPLQVSLLYYVGTTKSHPPIPEHLSAEAKDFLLKCLQKEPDMRSVASDLLQETSKNELPSYVVPTVDLDLSRPGKLGNLNSYKSSDTRPLWDLQGNDDDICEFADKDDGPMVGS